MTNLTDLFNGIPINSTLNTDTDVSSNNWVLDEDNMISDSNTKVPTQQSVKAYVDSNVGGGGSGFPLLVPRLMMLDDTNLNSDRGNCFNMIETIDFLDGATDGSCWVTFHFLDTLDATTDIKLDLIYSLNGADDSKTVRFVTSCWCKGSSETPSSSSPTLTNTNDISTGISQSGKILKTTLTAISNANISTNDVITFKFTRQTSSVSDTYSGTLQLIYVVLYQT